MCISVGQIINLMTIYVDFPSYMQIRVGPPPVQKEVVVMY